MGNFNLPGNCGRRAHDVRCARPGQRYCVAAGGRQRFPGRRSRIALGRRARTQQSRPHPHRVGPLSRRPPFHLRRPFQLSPRRLLAPLPVGSSHSAPEATPHSPRPLVRGRASGDAEAVRSRSRRRTERGGKSRLSAHGADLERRDHVRGRVRGDALASASSAPAIGSVDMADIHKVGLDMAPMTMIQALRSAMDIMLGRDENVVIFGQDVGCFGGVFRCTEGLQAKYGKERVFDAPISEGGIVGAAVGMGAYGLRPVVEIQFADYFYPATDQIVSEASRLRYRSAGEFTAPITIRMPSGGGIYGGQTHSQSPEALFTHVAGLRTVIPSKPYDAKGLLIAAIECDDPVIFLEPK